MTQRLALDLIMKNQVQSYDEMRRKEADSLMRLTQKQKGEVKEWSSYPPHFVTKPDVTSTVTNLVQNIHANMKTANVPRLAVPTIPAAIANMADKPLRTEKHSKSLKISCSRCSAGQSSRTAPTTKKMTIPIVKAKLQQNAQKILRRGYADITPKNFTNQRNIREILQQKTVLQNMLVQHQRLKQYRQMLALDMQRMRKDLDVIRTRLDNSMQCLSSTRTMFGDHPTGMKLTASKNKNAKSKATGSSKKRRS